MRLKTLNGAPLAKDLDFNEAHLFKASEREPVFRDFLSREPLQPSIPGSEDVVLVKWRRLEAAGTRLRSGWSQPHLPGGDTYGKTPQFSFSGVPNLNVSFDSIEQTQRFNDTTIGFEGHSIQVDDFVQHSLAFHDTLLSSQIADDTFQDDTISSSSFLTTSFDSAISKVSDEDSETNEASVLQLPPKVVVTPLGSLPNAKYLQSIYPQTPTPTLLCVLTADVELREVIVRRGGYKMQIYEITVADNTGPTLKVSFWFRPGRNPDPKQETLRKTVDELKTGDILLLRNIALNIYNDNVYGQSLNTRISKARTTVEVLSRADGSSRYKHIIPVAVDEVFTKVKKWAFKNVVPEAKVTKKRKGDMKSNTNGLSKLLKTSNGDDYLPPDTMET